MIRLNLTNKPAWVELLAGLRVEIAPVNRSLLTAARRHELMEGVDEEADPEEAGTLFARAVARLSIVAWEGVEDEDGQPAPVTHAHIDALLEHASVFDAWQTRVMAPALGLEAEKNGSAPSLNGTTAGAPDIATPAQGDVQTARKPSTPHTA